MRTISGALLLTLVLSPLTAVEAACPDLLDHEIRKLRSSEKVNLCDSVAGRPVLIVNTASHCGFTPQFSGLETLYQRYRERGLAVVGVPSNSFRQAARDEEAAAKVCFVNYGVTFTMLSEQDVTGPGAHPMFQALAREAGAPTWNFNKYLIDRDGRVTRFDSTVKPMSSALRAAVESTL